MHTTRFFLAPEWPQQVALERIAKFREFTLTYEAAWRLRDAIEAEAKKSKPRRKILTALQEALSLAK
jgi:hypothetical protein